MAYKVHVITTYNYLFDARAGGPGRLQLWGNGGKVAEVSFVDEATPVPDPILSGDLNSATIAFKRNALAGLIDMLRNEKPVKLTINNQPPGFVFIHTGPEPVGEGES
ncbi:MAG TPA: hypothetical protein VJA21_19950 [Verrucomicrobiae bacterium]